MNELMLSSGKYYMVIGVVLIILLGLFLYLWSIDRKLSRLEHQSKKEQS